MPMNSMHRSCMVVFIEFMKYIIILKKNNFRTSTKKTLIFYNFCMRYPNVVFFGASKPPITWQQEKKIQV